MILSTHRTTAFRVFSPSLDPQVFCGFYKQVPPFINLENRMINNYLMTPPVHGYAALGVYEYPPFPLSASAELSLDFLPHFPYIA